MNVKQITERLEIQSLNNIINDTEVESVYIGDLLSVVMASGKEGCLWLTVQKGINVIAVADLNDFAAIIFVQNSMPENNTLQKASELQIPLFITELDAYTLTKQLHALGI